jgi:hypothetical protein
MESRDGACEGVGRAFGRGGRGGLDPRGGSGKEALNAASVKEGYDDSGG